MLIISHRFSGIRRFRKDTTAGIADMHASRDLMTAESLRQHYHTKLCCLTPSMKVDGDTERQTIKRTRVFMAIHIKADMLGASGQGNVVNWPAEQQWLMGR